MPEAVGYAIGDGGIDVGELADHALADGLGFDLAQLEDEGRDDVVLLRLGLRVEELPRLREVVGEGLGADAQLVALHAVRRRLAKPRRGSWRGVSASSELGE